MKIEITFDEENNEFANVMVDGQTFEYVQGRPDGYGGYGWVLERHLTDTIGSFVVDNVMGIIPNLINLRSIQGRLKTWEQTDDSIVLALAEECCD